MPYSKRTPIWVYILLFAISFITCTIAGTHWAFKDYTQIENWHYGLQYAVLVLTFLTAHEFGHYFAARYHKVDSTLPFYIPFPFTDIPLNFGTMGAVIKTRDPIPDKKALFDIGIAGPLAGFAVCVIYLIYGFTHLPGEEFLLSIHPEYFHSGIPDSGLYFGNTLFFNLMKEVFASPGAFIPPMNEVYHYPFLNVGWFGLFVTTLNMLPMGQLDGGHIVYAMFGRIHRTVARVIWWILIFLGTGGLLKAVYELMSLEYKSGFMQSLKSVLYPPLSFMNEHLSIWFACWSGWIVWAVIGKFFVKLDHPPIQGRGKLGTGRMLLGWISLVILLLCFSYNGIYIIE